MSDELTPEVTLEQSLAAEMFPAEAEITPEPTEEPEVPEGVDEAEEVEEAQETPEPTPTEVFDVNGRQLSKTDIEQYAKFADWVEANPAVWQQLQQMQMQADPLVPTPTEPQEWEDPEERIARLEGQLGALMQERTTRTQAEFMASLSDSIEQFKSSHPELDEDGINRTLVRLRDLEILPSFYQKYPARPVAAALAALDTAYKVEFYDRAPARQPASMSEARARRRAASASPVPSSAPRENAAPETPEEHQQEMIAKLREAMQS